MSLLWYFLAGTFGFNGMPHLIKGIAGQTHMTPFAKVSSPLLNVIWAFINFVLALWFLGFASGNGGLTTPWMANLNDINLIAFLAGGLFISIMDANLFGKPNAHLPWQK